MKFKVGETIIDEFSEKGIVVEVIENDGYSIKFPSENESIFYSKHDFLISLDNLNWVSVISELPTKCGVYYVKFANGETGSVKYDVPFYVDESNEVFDLGDSAQNWIDVDVDSVQVEFWNKQEEGV